MSERTEHDGPRGDNGDSPERRASGDCPSHRQLQMLLAATLSPGQQEALEDHLESCASCRQLLEMLACDERWARWKSLLQHSTVTGHRPSSTDGMLPNESRTERAASAPASSAETVGNADTTSRQGQLPSDPQAKSAEAPLPLLPGYEILDELGRGGMGVVYRARQLELNRIVAVKTLLHGQLSSPERLARFESEAAAAAKLCHPHIVQIHAIAVHGGLPVITLQCIDGPSLAEVMHSGPQPVRASASLVATLARAVGYAHEQGVIHRDLKPANILLEPRTTMGAKAPRVVLSPGSEESMDLTAYEPKIADFGLARLADEEQQFTRSDDLLGTPAYMTPEQAAGGTNWTTPAVDIHALGVILYELVTGVSPFSGRTPLETLERVQYASPRPPHALHRAVPRDLSNIILKCLEKNPRRRYGTAVELAEDLERLLEYQPVRARPIGPLQRAWRWSRRHWASSILAVVLLLAVTLAGAVIALQSRTARQTFAELSQAHYLDRIRQAHQAWTANRLQQMRAHLEACPPKWRRWEWGYLQRLAARRPLRIRAHQGPVRGLVALSANAFVSAGDDGQLIIWNQTSGSRQQVLLSGDSALHTLVASVERNELLVIDADGHAIVLHALQENPHIAWRDTSQHFVAGCFVKLANRRAVALTTFTGVSQLRDAETGELLPRLFDAQAPVLALCFQRATGRLCALTAEHNLVAWDLNSENSTIQVLPLPVSGNRIEAGFFSADGTLLAARQDDHVVKVFETASGTPEFSRLAHAGPTTCCAVESLPGLLATTGEDGASKFWSLEDPLGRGLVVHRNHDASIHACTFGMERKTFLSGDQSGLVLITQLDTKGDASLPAMRTLAGHQGPVVGLKFSRDGRYLGTCSHDQRAHIYRCDRWQRVRSIDHPDQVRAIDFSADGQYFVTACDDRRVRVFGFEAATPRQEFAMGGENCTAIACHPRLDWIATGMGRQTSNIQLWDAASAERIRALDGHDLTVRYLEFDPTGDRLVSAGGTQVRVWDTNTGEMIHDLEGHEGRVFSARFSPDGKRIVSSGTDMAARVWDVNTGDLVCSIPLEVVAQTHTAIHPDGDRVALLNRHRLTFFDLRVQQVVLRLEHGEQLSRAVQFSPSGKYLVAPVRDNTYAVNVFDGYAAGEGP